MAFLTQKMKIICTCAILALTACASNRAQSKLEELYSFALAIENASSLGDAEARWRRRDLIHSKGREFWQSYADEKSIIGSEKSRKRISDLLANKGAATVLIVPTLTDFRGADVDQVIDQFLLDGGKATEHLNEILGDPRQIDKVNAYRRTGK